MSHERFTEGVFESRWKAGVQPEFYSGEYKPRHHVVEKNATDRINQINMIFTNINMPVVVFEMVGAGKPDAKNTDKGSIIWDIIEMIFEAIGKMFKTPFQKGKEV
jgi:hypothetical protein